MSANRPIRIVLRDLSRMLTLVSFVMLMLSAWTILFAGTSPASAATDAGIVQIVQPGSGAALASGGSGTAFNLSLPSGAACTGDSAGAGYRVQSFIIPSSVDPDSLRFGADGPIPVDTGVNLRQPLYSTTGTPFVNALTDIATTPNGPGTISGLPQFNFSVYAPDGATLIPPGSYRLGVACTLGNSSSATQLDRFWSVTVTFEASVNDSPAGIVWTVDEDPPPSTSTTSTTVGSTTTTIGDSTTTTVDGSTSTTVGGSSTTTVFGGGGTGPQGTGLGQLPLTGKSDLALFVWAVLLVIFGRMAILFARPVKVRTGNS